ncbi:MAG: hypothetical protein JWQ87_268 [Candidatus Sulfotelmatobacter sp.]|nr:hypothetical protein [Candidatus Sulfotelmatobacter sp.]
MNKANDVHRFALLRAMARVGVPVDLSVVERERNVEIEQIGGVHESLVFDLRDGRAGCIIDLSIINQTSKSILIRDIELRAPWSDSQFEWLSDPQETRGDPFNYHFPGKNAFECPRAQALNHVLLPQGILKPGFPIEGCLLGIGRRKPEQLFHGLIDFSLVIVGYDHNEYHAGLQVWVDPAWKRTQDLSRKISKISPPRERAGHGKIRPSRERAREERRVSES